jgi:phenylpropionate dioxygenase-like ring-hydroxylating dioxygenase large terminal subunit
VLSAVRTSARYGDLVRRDGMIHQSVFTDPTIFDEEMIKVFGGSWVFLAHEAEIPKPNDFKSITVGRRPTLVTRGSDGRIHALLNRCTHRGSPVCITAQGNAKRFVCPYHAWAFDIAGELQSVPFPDGYGEQFDKKSRHLGRFPRVESYRGYIFGSLNANVEALTDYLAGAREVIDWSVDQDRTGPSGVRVVRGAQMSYRGNWKGMNDNNTDGYHAPFLHSPTAVMNLQRHGAGRGLAGANEYKNMRTQYLGNGHRLLDQRNVFTSPWDRARPMPGRETHRDSVIAEFGEDEARRWLNLAGRGGINLIVYPNLFVLGHGSFAVYEPVTVSSTNVRYYTSLLNDAPDEINTLRIRFEEDFNNLGTRDDLAQMEEIQQTLGCVPELEWLDFSRGLSRESADSHGIITGDKTDETPVRHAYTHWARLMDREVKLSVI